MVVTKSGECFLAVLGLLYLLLATDYELRYTLPIAAVDTHRPKPNAPQPEIKIANVREYYTPEVTKSD